jgi:hypothetical protein
VSLSQPVSPVSVEGVDESGVAVSGLEVCVEVSPVSWISVPQVHNVSKDRINGASPRVPAYFIEEGCPASVPGHTS